MGFLRQFFRPKVKLLRVAYISIAAPGTTSGDVRELTLQAQRLNGEHGITGALIFNGRNFLQIIEGPDAAISTLIQRIRVDKRHYNFDIQFERLVSQRCFPAWSMQLILPLDREGPEMPDQLEPPLQSLWRSFGTLR